MARFFKATMLVSTEDETSVEELASYLDQNAFIDIADGADDSPCGAVSIELIYDPIPDAPSIPGLKVLSVKEMEELGHTEDTDEEQRRDEKRGLYPEHLDDSN